MDQHFHFQDEQDPDDAWAEQVGRTAAKIFFIGLAVALALLMVSGGLFVLSKVVGS